MTKLLIVTHRPLSYDVDVADFIHVNKVNISTNLSFISDGVVPVDSEDTTLTVRMKGLDLQPLSFS